MHAVTDFVSSHVHLPFPSVPGKCCFCYLISYALSILFHVDFWDFWEKFDEHILFKVSTPENTSLHNDQWISVLYVI